TSGKNMEVKLIHNDQLFCAPVNNLDNKENFIKIIDVNNGNEVKAISIGMDGNVRDVKIHGKKLFVNTEWEIKVIDLENEGDSRVIPSSENNLNLCTKGHALFLFEAGIRDIQSKIKIIDMRTEAEIKTIDLPIQHLHYDYMSLFGDL